MDKLPDGVTREGDDENLKPSVPISKPVKVDLPKHCTWTNEAARLALTTYFDPTLPNLSSDFGLNSLQPVIRDTEDDVFLLQDGEGKFYQWRMPDGEIWRLDGFTDVQEAAKAIMRDSGILKKTQIWNLDRPDKH